jgi:hypothetical protein
LDKIATADGKIIPDTVELLRADLIKSCWDGDPDHQQPFLQIFDELRAYLFKIFSGVDSQMVEQSLQSLL